MASSSGSGVALRDAAHRGQLQRVIDLLHSASGSSRTLMNSKSHGGETALHKAAGEGHVEVVKHLLDMGADQSSADSGRWTPLHLASSRGQLQVVQELLKRRSYAFYCSQPQGKSTDTQEDTPLICAVHNGHQEVARTLLLSGADFTIINDLSEIVDMIDEDYWTALHHAANDDRNAIAVMLLDTFSAEVDAVDNGGWTPLYLAMSDKGYDTAVELITRGAAKYRFVPNTPELNGPLMSPNTLMEKIPQHITELILLTTTMCTRPLDEEDQWNICHAPFIL